jgi:hypothetical protein
MLPAFDVGQPHVAAGVAERESFVVDAEEVQIVACESWM